MERSTLVIYTVPSQSQADVRYTVSLWDGDAHCNCPWGSRSGDTPIHCWHVRLARLLHECINTPDLGELVTADGHRAACGGGLLSQLYIIRMAQELLLEREEYARASKAAEMLSKYLHALSFTGALPVYLEHEPTTQPKEGAATAAPSLIRPHIYAQ